MPTKNLNSEAPEDSKSTFRHCGDVLAVGYAIWRDVLDKGVVQASIHVVDEGMQ